MKPDDLKGDRRKQVLLEKKKNKMLEEARHRPSRVLETGGFIKGRSSCGIIVWKRKSVVQLSA